VHGGDHLVDVEAIAYLRLAKGPLDLPALSKHVRAATQEATHAVGDIGRYREI